MLEEGKDYRLRAKASGYNSGTAVRETIQYKSQFEVCMKTSILSALDTNYTTINTGLLKKIAS
jgi:hypothetical protein